MNQTKDHKVHTGFRLSRKNMNYLEQVSEKLGLTRTNVVDMILTLMQDDASLLPKLLKDKLSKQD